VATALDTTPVGGSTEAFPVADGWVIFRVIERKQGEIMPPEDVEAEIRKVMFQKKFNENIDRLLTLLRDNSEIVYFEDRIANYLGGTSDK
jgi:parvulin-like peptidyl-prolyl isomerase